MCIRDRAAIAQSETLDHVDEIVAQFVSRLNLERGVLILGAVSYTHLRAHETVLDLVCRLLLEKKKRKTYRDARLVD